MSQVPPTVQYLIVCEDVQIDADNMRRVSLVGLLGAIRSVGQAPFPLLYRELCVFLQLTECRGTASGHVVIQNADSEQSIFRTATRPIPFGNEPLETYGVVFRIRNCVFPAPGLYWVQFWYDEQLLAQQALLLRE